METRTIKYQESPITTNYSRINKELLEISRKQTIIPKTMNHKAIIFNLPQKTSSQPSFPYILHIYSFTHNSLIKPWPTYKELALNIAAYWLRQNCVIKRQGRVSRIFSPETHKNTQNPSLNIAQQ